MTLEYKYCDLKPYNMFVLIKLLYSLNPQHLSPLSYCSNSKQFLCIALDMKGCICYFLKCHTHAITHFSIHIHVASELKDPIWHSSEWLIGSFSSEATIHVCGIIIRPFRRRWVPGLIPKQGSPNLVSMLETVLLQHVQTEGCLGSVYHPQCTEVTWMLSTSISWFRQGFRW